MSDSLALTPPRREQPASLEAMAMFRVKAVELHGPPAPAADPVDKTVVVVTGADGGVVVYPSSPKLVILSAERNRLRPEKKFSF